MAAARGVPTWLKVCKEDLSRSEEWKALTSELYDAVKQQLAESHVSYFTELTDCEKILFLDRAAKLVQDGSAHRTFVQRVSGVVDFHLNEDVVCQKLMDASNARTKTELLLSEASATCVALLQRWPELRSKLYSCLNHSLPFQLRKAMWKMLLENRSVRLEYLHNVSTHRSCASPHDAAITRNCEAYLSSDSLDREQLSAKPAILRVMRTALSHRDTQLRGNSTLVDTDYLLAIPFLKVLIGDPDVVEVGGDEVASFIELYSTFMDCRPLVMKDSGSKEFYTALKQFGATMATILQARDKQLAEALQCSCSEGKAVQLKDCLANLMRPYVRCLFVGFLALDVVCYIWDQVLLTMKLPKLCCIATFSVVMLVLLKRDLVPCRNGKEIRHVLHERCKDLKLRDFQTEIERVFLSEWQQTATGQARGPELPLVDPVAAHTAAPWFGWFSEKPPTRERPGDRRAVREARGEERRRLQAERELEERRRRKEDEQLRRDREARLRRELEEAHRKERGFLEDQLAAEREARENSELNMRQEIRRLEAQLARLGVSPRPSSGADSASPGRIPPAPRRGPSAASPVSDSEKPQAALVDTVKSLLGAPSRALQLLVSGDDERRRDLDRVARHVVDTNGRDFREVQAELFGRELSAEDWDRMDAEDREQNFDDFVARIRRRREERQLAENGT